MRRPDRTVPQLPADWRDQDVLGLDDAGVLGFVIEQRRARDAADAAEMHGVCAWADRHRVHDPESDGHGSVDADVDAIVSDEVWVRARCGDGWSFAGPDGIEGLLRLCGQNAYLVTEFAITELAVGLRMSEAGARRLTGEALEVRDRLPRIWARVMSGDLPAWKARRVAEQTIPLADGTARWVDAQLAPFANRLSLHRISRCVEAAMLRFEPDRAAERARKAADGRGVWTEDHLDGTSTVTAVTGTPDATAFDRVIGDVASTLGSLGDTDDLAVRRAKAIGVLADPQRALDLMDESSGEESQVVERRSRPPHAPARQAFHFHLHLADAAIGPVVRVDAPGVHGPVSLASVEQWLRDLAPGAVVKLTPVVDLNGSISVDAYEVPTRIADVVDHRDLCCQFPWCGRRGRHDLDHIEPFLAPDDGGPPGQTSTVNLAKLCRFHHRVKTHSDWTYRREPHGALIWTSPLGRTYLVDGTGTTNL